jgi:hypothetical protein
VPRRSFSRAFLDSATLGLGIAALLARDQVEMTGGLAVVYGLTLYNCSPRASSCGRQQAEAARCYGARACFMLQSVPFALIKRKA